MPKARKKLIVSVAALGHELVKLHGSGAWQGGAFSAAEGVFPAVTCTAQATFRTAALPNEHGMVCNGLYHRTLRKAMFWEQASTLVEGPRIWDKFRANGRTVGMMFWQQSLGESVDLVLSPAPIHKHHGGMIMDCQARPADLYTRLKQELGPFRLKHYWGPLANAKVGDWIARATAFVMHDARTSPHLLLTYLPTLDYDLQRHGPSGDHAARAMTRVMDQLELLRTKAESAGYDMLVFGDYAIGPARSDGAVFPNRALADEGLMATRDVQGMFYPNLHDSRAFAMVDHEVAHVYVPRKADLSYAAELLTELDGVAEVLDRPRQADRGIDHPNGGELVLVADEGRWFAYPWWTDPRQAPDYASHIDIHNKPGFDPCELYFKWFPPGVSQDSTRIGGTHGLAGPTRPIAWWSSAELPGEPKTLVDLAQLVGQGLP
ncbi:MAG: alkaline phosphatase family protein [Planctomycetia bacterium]|jgi:predicted AlkP superfamily pyrophosphatase or phosphodiesterase